MPEPQSAIYGSLGYSRPTSYALKGKKVKNTAFESVAGYKKKNRVGSYADTYGNMPINAVTGKTEPAAGTAEYVPIEAMLLPGTPMIKGLGKTGNFIVDLLNPTAGMGKRPGLNKFYNPGRKTVSEFTSEVNWGKWNPDTPKYPELINEYNTIEKSTKQTGTWMKNPDGSTFEGTPEQFIQEQSSHFKKVFPKGANYTYRGTKDINPILGDKEIFTGDKTTASKYVGNDGELLSLVYPKNDTGLNLNAAGSWWQGVEFGNKNEIIQRLKKEIKNASTQNKVRDNSDFYNAIINDNTKKIESLKTIKDDRNILQKAYTKRNMMNRFATSTDELGNFIKKKDKPYINISNINDRGTPENFVYGDVNIINNKPGNYLKSRIGNVGFFDMKNPNIYKSLVPIVGTTGAASYLMSRKKEAQNKFYNPNIK